MTLKNLIFVLVFALWYSDAMETEADKLQKEIEDCGVDDKNNEEVGLKIQKCAVCLEDVQIETPHFKTACNHFVHSICVNRPRRKCSTQCENRKVLNGLSPVRLRAVMNVNVFQSCAESNLKCSPGESAQNRVPKSQNMLNPKRNQNHRNESEIQVCAVCLEDVKINTPHFKTCNNLIHSQCVSRPRRSGYCACCKKWTFLGIGPEYEMEKQFPKYEHCNSLEFYEVQEKYKDKKTCCSICLDALDGSEAYFHWPVCGHEFHHKCINGWKEEKNTCPNCRKRMMYRAVRKDRKNANNINRLRKLVSRPAVVLAIMNFAESLEQTQFPKYNLAGKEHYEQLNEEYYDLFRSDAHHKNNAYGNFRKWSQQKEMEVVALQIQRNEGNDGSSMQTGDLNVGNVLNPNIQKEQLYEHREGTQEKQQGEMTTCKSKCGARYLLSDCEACYDGCGYAGTQEQCISSCGKGLNVAEFISVDKGIETKKEACEFGCRNRENSQAFMTLIKKNN